MEACDSLSCSEVRKLLGPMCSDRLEPAQYLRVKHHLRHCAECRQAFFRLAAREFFAHQGDATPACSRNA